MQLSGGYDTLEICPLAYWNSRNMLGVFKITVLYVMSSFVLFIIEILVQYSTFLVEMGRIGAVGTYPKYIDLGDILCCKVS